MRLLESQEAMELAVVKALNGELLTVEEIDELRDLTVRDLMVDHDLDHVLADKVLSHVKIEDLRMNAQNLETPIEDYEDDLTTATRTSPIAESKINTRSSLDSLLRRLISEELTR